MIRKEIVMAKIVVEYEVGEGGIATRVRMEDFPKNELEIALGSIMGEIIHNLLTYIDSKDLSSLQDTVSKLDKAIQESKYGRGKLTNDLPSPDKGAVEGLFGAKFRD